MMRNLPSTASVAEPGTGAKLHAPAAARNAQAICDALGDHAPTTGHALEIASGTGQHVVAYARAFTGLHWQPSEIDPDRRASIDAHVTEAGLSNVSPCITLDACAPDWATSRAPVDLIVLVNLLHLISDAEARTLLDGVAQTLSQGGCFFLYGPFRRDGRLTSDGDIRFDAELRGADPLIGYKDTRAIEDWLGNVGLNLHGAIEMPANNLALVARKP